MNRLHRRRWRSPAVLICTAVGVVLIALLVTLALKRSVRAPYVYTDLSTEESFADESFENAGKWYGLCRKDSIRSIEDFQKTVASDQLLKAHFADFKWENAVVKRLEKPIFAYVFFRKNDTIFRKAKPIKLPAGDEYITDGKKRIRTHCCNDFAEAPPPLVEASSEGNPLESAPNMAALPSASGASPTAPAVASSQSSSSSPFWMFWGSPRSGGRSDPGCTGPECNTEPGCVGPECGSDPVCTGPGCGSDPVCTGPGCGPYRTPEPSIALLLAIAVAILAVAFLLRRLLIRRAGSPGPRDGVI